MNVTQKAFDCFCDRARGKHAIPWLWLLIMAVLLSLFVLLPSAAMAQSEIFLDVKPIYQADYPTPLFQYKGQDKSVSTSGCGAVCVSMALSLLLPEAEQTPETLLLWAYEEGLYKGNGLSHKTMGLMLEAHGLEGKWLGKKTKTLRVALKAGKPIIAYMGPGTFTNSGHYILISGIDRKDRCWVIDPNCERLSMRWYPLKAIFHQAGSKHPFLVCGVQEKE